MGVVDHRGRAFTGAPGDELHEGLWVADGSMVPTPLGTNPLFTISALAERTSTFLLDALRGLDLSREEQDEQERQDEPLEEAGDERSEGRVPLSVSGWPVGSRRRATTSAEAGAHQAEADRQWAEVVLDVDYDDLEQVLRAAGQRGAAERYRVDRGAVARGDAGAVWRSPALRAGRRRTSSAWTMEYHLDLRSQEGRVYELHGVKHLDRGLPHVAWPRTSTLFTEVTDESGTVVAAGILRLTVPDFLRQLTTMRVTNTDDLVTKLIGAPRFFGMFSAMLVRQFGGAVRASSGRSRPGRRSRSLGAGQGRGPHVVVHRARRARSSGTRRDRPTTRGSGSPATVVRMPTAGRCCSRPASACRPRRTSPTRSTRT